MRRDIGEAFYESPEIVSTYLVLQTILQPGDDVALSAALGSMYFPNVDPSQQELDQLQYRPTEGAPLTDWLAREHPDQAVLLAELRAALRTDTAPQFLGRLYSRHGIVDMVRVQGQERQAERLERLREEARRLFRSEEALTVRIFADYLRLRILQRYDVDMPSEAADEPRPDHVRVMTIHRAKGLQFPVVIVPGLWAPLMSEQHEPEFFVSAGEGLDLRLRRAPVRTTSRRWQRRMQEHRGERLREEFRLLYVAITRAQHSVVLVGDHRGPTNGPNSPYYCWRDELLPAVQALRGSVSTVHVVTAGSAAALLPQTASSRGRHT